MKRNKTVIGFLGPVGSFSHEASIVFQKRLDLKTKLNPYSSYGLAEALKKNEIQKAVLPIENSQDGQVNWVIDLLAEDYPFFIEHEVVLTIRQNLIGFGRISGIEKIYSHPVALGQCHKLLKDLAVATQDLDSTSSAVKLIAETKNQKWAAIGSRLAAEIYNTPVIKEDVQDNSSNQTRFVVLGKEKKRKNKDSKTSLLFIVDDEPGALVRVLEIFDVLDVNMSTIFSRPLKTKLGQYMFFVDIKGHQTDRKIGVALETLRSKAKSLKILGSYSVSKG